MSRETKAEMQKRLEKEVKELRKELKESYELITKLEDNIKAETVSIDLETQDNILLQVENNIETEELAKIERFNEIYGKEGVYLEIKNFRNTYIRIRYDTNKNKRGAGRKQKLVKGSYTLEEVEKMIAEKGAEEVSTQLGISRATLFRKLKRCRSLGNPTEHFF